MDTTICVLTGYAQATILVTINSGISGYEGVQMDALMFLVLVVAGLVVFDVAAVTHGVDSRDTMPDDHRR